MAPIQLRAVRDELPTASSVVYRSKVDGGVVGKLACSW